MKRILVLIIAATVVVSVCEVSLSSKYIQRHDESGWLFHILSQKMNSTDRGIKDADIDYTYLEATDSVTILATLVMHEVYHMKNCVIVSCGHAHEYELNLIYLRPKGKRYVYRLETVIPFSLWDEMFNCGSPFLIRYNFDGYSCSFSYSESKWVSKRKPYCEIIEIVKFNVGRK